MTGEDIAWQRLYTQQLAGSRLQRAEDVVRSLCVIQAEDYPAAKWAVAQRSTGLTDADLDLALADGRIIRTHAMRPTWQFVTPADLGWVLQLTAPRINQANAYMYRKVGLDEPAFKKSQAVLRRILRGKQLTRREISEALQQAGLTTTSVPLRFPYILMRAEIDKVICSGGRRGKQFTYALFEERVPPAPVMTHDEALQEFVTRFFAGHGPATIRDFAIWSGLTLADSRRGLEMAKPRLDSVEVEGLTLWFAKGMRWAKPARPLVRLIPALDEYFIGYHDYLALLLEPARRQQLASVGGQAVIVDGKVVGIWKRTLSQKRVLIDPELFGPLTSAQKAALDVELERYKRFLRAREDLNL